MSDEETERIEYVVQNRVESTLLLALYYFYTGVHDVPHLANIEIENWNRFLKQPVGDLFTEGQIEEVEKLLYPKEQE